MIVCRDTRTFRGTDFIKNSMWKVATTNGANKCVLEDCSGQPTQVPVELAMEEYGGGRGLQCRFGYVLTCHTAQGSEWPTVMVHGGEAEAYRKQFPRDARQWLYTAVTRAKEKLLWVGDELSVY